MNVTNEQKTQQQAIARCEAILQEAGLASLIVVASAATHSYGLRTPPESLFQMVGKNYLIAHDASDLGRFENEHARLNGLKSGTKLMLQSVQKMADILVKQARNTLKKDPRLK